MQAAKAGGGLTLQRLLDMQEQGIAVADVTSDELRASLYSKEVGPTIEENETDYDYASASCVCVEERSLTLISCMLPSRML